MITDFENEALQCLKAYEWPGNVRELKNIMERIVVLSPEGKVQIENIPVDIRRSAHPSSSALISHETPGTSHDISLMEKEMIRRALLGVKGNKSLAAKKLGISRRTLYRKLDEYGLS